MKQLCHCFFDMLFRLKNGLQFQMRCVVKMENIFAYGGLMTFSTSNVFRKKGSYF